MVVCHCLALNDATIANVAAMQSQSVDLEDVVDAVVQACGAGSECGGCRPLIEEILEQVVSRVEPQVVFIG